MRRAGPHRPRGRVEENSVEIRHDLGRRPALFRPRAEPVRQERVYPVRPERAEDLPPLVRRQGRRGHGRIAQRGREVEEPVGREREKGVRPAARERESDVELAEAAGERRVGGRSPCQGRIVRCHRSPCRQDLVLVRSFFGEDPAERITERG